MEIKKVNLVSREVLEGFVKSLEFSIESIQCGRPQDATWALKRLKDNIEANLKEEI